MKRRKALSALLCLMLALCMMFISGCSNGESSGDTSDDSTNGSSEDSETTGEDSESSNSTGEDSESSNDENSEDSLSDSENTNSEGSEDSEDESSEDKIVVAVSIVPEATFVEAVCGDLVEVVTMIPAGSSPSNYEPTASEMEAFYDASVYFAIGVPTEELNILPSVEDVPVVYLQDAVAEVYDELTLSSGSRDPHIWLSPKRVTVMIETIAEYMCELDPDNADVYNANAADYIEQLDELDEYIAETLADVENRIFIVYHPAFGYFADDYDLTMYALEEDGDDATAETLEELVDMALDEGIKVIFYQQEIDSSQSEAFAEEIGGETMQLSPLAANYIENLKAMADLMAEVME